jgi:hypothetical protein
MPQGCVSYRMGRSLAACSAASRYRDGSDTRANSSLDSLASHDGHVACHRRAGDLADRCCRGHVADVFSLRCASRPIVTSFAAYLLHGEMRLLRAAQPSPCPARCHAGGTGAADANKQYRHHWQCPCHRPFRTGSRCPRATRFLAALNPDLPLFVACSRKAA